MSRPRDPRAVAAQFALAGPITRITPLRGGHINESWRVEAGGEPYLLQRVNPHVFPDIPRVLHNVQQVSAFRAARLRRAGVADWRRRAPLQIPPQPPWSGPGDGLLDDEGGGWRVFTFVANTTVRERALVAADAYSAGSAFGEFLRLVADWDGPPLEESIPGFHDTAGRLARLDEAIRRDGKGRARAASEEIASIMTQRDLAEVLPPLLRSGAVPCRIAHNDAKISNILFDEPTGEPLCVVDLDTVMPGSALYDFGDLVRSTTSPTFEDEDDLSRVGVDSAFFAALAQGYLERAGSVLTSRERGLLVFAGRLVTLEQAARFLTDHLEGDRYYRIGRPGQNLSRCRVQLALLRSLTAAGPGLEEIVAGIGPAATGPARPSASEAP